MKSILVTGSSSGIGAAICEHFSQIGWKVFGSVRNQNDGDKLTDICGENFTPLIFDVTDINAINEAANLVESHLGKNGLNCLVNNAGILTPTLLEDIDEETWDSHFEVNTKGVLLMCQSVLPHMREKKSGRIINIASIAGRQGSPTQGHYASTKSAVITLTRVLAQEVGEAGITVNAICPGIILTEMGKNNLGSEKEIAHWSNVAALKRLGDPKDIIGPTVFFASNLSDFVTGQSINVCGGIYFH